MEVNIMEWPRHLLDCPLVFEPVAALPVEVTDIGSFAHMQKDRKGERPWALKKNAKDLHVVGGVIERGFYAVYLMVCKWREHMAGEESTERLVEIQKIARTVSGGQLQVQLAKQLSDAAAAEIARIEICKTFYDKDITSLSLLADGGVRFFTDMISRMKQCVVQMRASGLFPERPHQSMMQGLLTMTELIGNMMFYYDASLLPTLSDIGVIECMERALYFRKKLRSGFWFIDGWFLNSFGARVTRNAPRPCWSELACDLVKTSNFIGFNVAATHTAPVCKY